MMVIFNPPSRTMGIGLGANAIGVMFAGFCTAFFAPHIDDSVAFHTCHYQRHITNFAIFYSTNIRTKR